MGTTVTGLTPSTTYYIRAYQYTDGLDPSDASEWSSIISGTTSAASGGGSSSTGTDAGYTGTGGYTTSGGGTVDVESALGGTGDGTIDSGTSNGGGSNISKTFDDTKQTAILVDDTTGVVTQVTGSPVTIPPGSTLFVKSTQLDRLTISNASLMQVQDQEHLLFRGIRQLQATRSLMNCLQINNFIR